MSDTEIRLTKREQKAIKDLKALARRWPKTLWLFSASGTLTVMKAGPDGERVMYDGLGSGVDHAMKVDVIRGIPNDGGDW